MLVASRLAGLSALEGHYADDNAQAQSGLEVDSVNALVTLTGGPFGEIVKGRAG